MRTVTLDDALVDRLTQTRGNGLVSVLLPTHTKGPETAQDRLRLKNALTEVDDRLETAGWRRSVREGRLATARDLLDDDEFWAHQDHGLALFVGESGEVTPVALGDTPPSLITIADCFHVRHLLGCLLRRPLPALVLTKGDVGLFSVDTHRAWPVTDVDLPSSFDDVNWFTDREKMTNRHADRRGSAGVQHGHDPNDRRHEDVLRFVRAVDDALDPVLAPGPLVVLGDDPLIEDFRKVSDRDVVGLGLDGSARAGSESEVWRRVRPIIDDRLESELDANTERAREALGVADTVTMFPDALYGAISGRYSHLYVRRTAEPIWGRFDPNALDAAAGPDPGVGAVDLLDRLVATARGTGAEVRLMAESADGHDFVAVRRF